MRIAIGADPRGFPLNERIIRELKGAGHDVRDFGTHDCAPDDDYPDYARLVGHGIQSGETERAISVCGSGVGACVAANKSEGIRARLVTTHIRRIKASNMTHQRALSRRAHCWQRTRARTRPRVSGDPIYGRGASPQKVGKNLSDGKRN